VTPGLLITFALLNFMTAVGLNNAYELTPGRWLWDVAIPIKSPLPLTEMKHLHFVA